MKPFIIGDKRFAFDVTNAVDLRRLEGAYAALCAKSEEQSRLADDGSCEMAASEQMRVIFAMYHDFFDAVFPGHAEEIIGDVPSVSRAGHAFDRFTAYLRSCVDEEEQNASVMRRFYLGDTALSRARAPHGNGDPA